MKILLVEDDIKISSFVKKGLVEENYIVDCAYDGEEALYLCDINEYSLILLDIMIPLINGIEVCKKLRALKNTTPIIVISAKDSIEDKVLGLNEGANDYISKPFSFEELCARIKVQLRTTFQPTNILSLNDLSLNLDTKKVLRNNHLITLSSKELSLLEYLLRNKNTVLTEVQISNSLWSMDDNTASNILNVYMYRLRNKIDKNYEPKLLHTLRGIGYKLSENR